MFLRIHELARPRALFYVPQSNQTGTNCTDTTAASYEAIAITLSLPLWSFIIIYLLLLLIHYLRSLQYFTLYDRCTSKQAHFKYDFHILFGRVSSNYTALESNVILDLLDNQLISTMTIQVPGTSIFNDQQIFMYRHSRSNVRCMSFTIYRRHPIKDVRCVRIAHGCSNPESRLFVYGINVRDMTNGESKFFPITSVVKYRGTQWALNTTFEPKQEVSFSKIGCNCYDPFGTSSWPTYVELLIIIFYVWCASLCFGSLISIDSLQNNIILHLVVTEFIVASTTGVIVFFYLRSIKSHVVDEHYDSYLWYTIGVLTTTLVLVLCFAFWFLAVKELGVCIHNSTGWIISSSCCALLMSSVLLVTLIVMNIRRSKRDTTTLEEYENTLTKTNSKTNIDFITETSPKPLVRQKVLLTANQVSNPPPMPPAALPPRRHNSKSNQAKNASGSNTAKRSNTLRKKSPVLKGSNETLDNATNGSGYLKTKNRNSISQYI